MNGPNGTRLEDFDLSKKKYQNINFDDIFLDNSTGDFYHYNLEND